MIIFNKWIPFRGFNAMNLFGVIFVRKDGVINKFVLNHEKIHSRQQIEMLIIPFYFWYVLEWILLVIKYRDRKKAYRLISFEQEAFLNEYNLNYLQTRKHYAWFRFLVFFNSR